jgi:four helix bundle protein
MKAMNSAELKARTQNFAVDIVGFVERLERNTAADVLGRQLIRSATSVAANYRSACRARSKAEFVSKIGVVEEEADETLFWLEMLVGCKKSGFDEVKPMMEEADQLLRIFAASHITAKQKRPEWHSSSSCDSSTGR